MLQLNLSLGEPPGAQCQPRCVDETTDINWLVTEQPGVNGFIVNAPRFLRTNKGDIEI